MRKLISVAAVALSMLPGLAASASVDGSGHSGASPSVLDHTKEAVGPDDTRYRAEFLKLVQKAKGLPQVAR